MAGNHTRLGVLRQLIQSNLQLLAPKQRLADDEPFVTLQVRRSSARVLEATDGCNLPPLLHTRIPACAAPSPPTLMHATAPQHSPQITPHPNNAPDQAQVGKQVFEAAPRQMRTELWKSALQRRGVGVAAAKSYRDLLAMEVRTIMWWCFV